MQHFAPKLVKICAESFSQRGVALIRTANMRRAPPGNTYTQTKEAMLHPHPTSNEDKRVTKAELYVKAVKPVPPGGLLRREVKLDCC